MHHLFLIFFHVFHIIWLVYQARRRKRAMEARAEEIGFYYDEMDRARLWDALSPFPNFRKHKATSLVNIMRATTDEIHVTVFDHYWARFRPQTMVLFESPMLVIPTFNLRPETLSDKLAAFHGDPDIDFAAFPKFSAHYRLWGPDERAIRRIFFADVVEYFDQKLGLSVRAKFGKLLVYRRAKQVKPEKLTDLLALGLEVYDLFKDD